MCQAIFIENVEEMCFFIAHVGFFIHIWHLVSGIEKKLLLVVRVWGGTYLGGRSVVSLAFVSIEKLVQTQATLPI